MEIKFVQRYKSIDSFNKINIEDFSVFLGVNGAGKTHLLKALQLGSVSADIILNEKISYFNLQSFLIKNQKEVTPRNLDDEKSQAWNILDTLRSKIQIYDEQIKKIVGEQEFPYEIDVSEDQKQSYATQRQHIINVINIRTEKSLKIRKLLKTGVFESKKYASELTKEEFFKFSNYNPDDYELLESLSEVFLDYQKKMALAKLPKDEAGEGVSFEKIQELEEESPWRFVNRMFEEFGLSHRIIYPNLKQGDFIGSQAISFQAKICVNDEEIDFEDLSSGEKVLCALAITVYQDDKSEFPELLLLDEVDASLHPSVIEQLLDVIENVFIKNGCKVILATHSSTTAALSPEKSLFEVQKGTVQQKIKKISQVDAINLLSEGIMTFEKGLKIQGAIDESKSLQIVTEGYNSIHIKKAIEILDDKLLSEVKIIEDAPDKRGQQLKNAFDVMSSVTHSGIFLFVWDCDFLSRINEIQETGSFKKFCFSENTENTKARDKTGRALGIENLYPDILFRDDVYPTEEKVGSYGTTSLVKNFNKKKFLKKVVDENNEEIFKNFKPLIERIRKLLELS
ncbi:MAG: ATP-binding protein [Candidatus Jacksonbacteria bacterium]|jgi:predicted ATPase|nr:ATP-binding protein [Candidatus Jacksonbacteria bacterium]MBT6757648.1 ATP-binding protein [Candidatus Jacksonbacteria bacterium]MBT7008334.1 ATP-binding protein [Candidatus Jacksonbacteria bacterium]MBT7338876.1 ATP-binding protein [Candidatus Jacksonbacteria bacterium]